MFEWPYVPGTASGSLLAIACWYAFASWRLLRGKEPAGFWGLAAAGLALLALDEWFEFHEHVAALFFPNLGVLNHPDDAIILGYAAAAAAIGAYFWRQIVSRPDVLRWLLLATAATAVAGALDAFGAPEHWLSAISEETCELSAGACAARAMYLRFIAARTAPLQSELRSETAVSPQVASAR